MGLSLVKVITTDHIWGTTCHHCKATFSVFIWNKEDGESATLRSVKPTKVCCPKCGNIGFVNWGMAEKQVADANESPN